MIAILLAVVFGLAIASAAISLVSFRVLGRLQRWKQRNLHAVSVVCPVITLIVTILFSCGLLTSTVPSGWQPTVGFTFSILALIALASALVPVAVVGFAQLLIKCWKGVCEGVDRVVP